MGRPGLSALAEAHGSLAAAFRGVAILAISGCQAFTLLLTGTPPGQGQPGGLAATVVPGAQDPSKPIASFRASLQGTISGPAKLLGNTGAALIGNTGAALIGNTGGALAGNTGGALAGSNSGAYKVLAFDQVRAAGAIVYLATPDEELFRDSNGAVVSTTADAQGRYGIPADIGRPLVVTAVLPHNRRLVGFTYLTQEGSASLDVSLETTYVTEFLRYQGRKQKKSMADYDLAKVRAITDLTRQMIETGDLSDSPSISIADIPGLVRSYLVAVSSKSRVLSDAWAELLGKRPVAVTTLPDSAEPSFKAIATASGAGRVWSASFNSTGVQVREIGREKPIFTGAGHRGFAVIQAMTAGPDGRLYFAETVDRRQGGALASEDRTQIRLFAYDSGTEDLEEMRLPVVPELASYVVDPTVKTAVEPSALAWHAGKLYMADREAGLIYEYGRDDSGAWHGSRFAGQVVLGRPAVGIVSGDRLETARFRSPSHLTWHDGSLFVASPAAGVIQKIAPDGKVTVIAGHPDRKGTSPDGTALADALLDFPSATAFDAQGRMVIADGDNHRILIVENGAIRVVAGGAGKATEDGDASTVVLGEVGGLAFDPEGNLLFFDIGTGKVRKLWWEFGL